MCDDDYAWQRLDERLENLEKAVKELQRLVRKINRGVATLEEHEFVKFR